MKHKKILSLILSAAVLLSAFSAAIISPSAAVTNPYSEAAMALDKEYAYDGALGAIYSPQQTVFKVWAPLASEVSLNRYATGSDSEPGAADLGAYTGGEVSVDLGSSDLYTEDELTDAVVQIKCKFAFWGDVDLKSIRYAGDEAATDSILASMNEIAPDANYTQVAEFLMDFHTPEDVGELTLNANSDYTDYQWWLARTDDGGWEIVTFGYGY